MPKRSVPVLKMPPELALPAVRVLASVHDPARRRSSLLSLRPGIPARTLLNAYVLPSLAELRLYEGTLRSGRVTRYAESIGQASDLVAQRLMARHLLGLDAERVGLVAWLGQSPFGGEARRHAVRKFLELTSASFEGSDASLADRLGKWINYLVYFGLVRETEVARESRLAVSGRHIEAMKRSDSGAPALASEARQRALLEAYSRTSARRGTRLYLPIAEFRDELGRVLEASGSLLPDSELDEIIKAAPQILKQHLVSFAPFSGPARGGLRLPDMYAGFISVRTRAKRDATSRKEVV